LTCFLSKWSSETPKTPFEKKSVENVLPKKIRDALSLPRRISPLAFLDVSLRGALLEQKNAQPFGVRHAHGHKIK
jgi:hypothetical protein